MENKNTHPFKEVLGTNAKAVGLSGVEKAVLVQLSFHFGRGDEDVRWMCCPSHKTLSDATGFGITAVKNAIRKLTELKFILVVNRDKDDGSRNSNLYIWKGFTQEI